MFFLTKNFHIINLHLFQLYVLYQLYSIKMFLSFAKNKASRVFQLNNSFYALRFGIEIIPTRQTKYIQLNVIKYTIFILKIIALINLPNCVGEM